MIRICVAAVVLFGSAPAHAYLKLGASINGTVVDVTWHEPVRYFVAERGVSGVSAADLRAAVERATATWSAVGSARVRFEFQGMTTAVPDAVDGRKIGRAHV